MKKYFYIAGLSLTMLCLFCSNANAQTANTKAVINNNTVTENKSAQSAMEQKAITQQQKDSIFNEERARNLYKIPASGNSNNATEGEQKNTKRK